jgi:hypothetical protein
MKYFEAPDYSWLYDIGEHHDVVPANSIFLAGSITGAWDWQKRAADQLLAKYNVFNPRRVNYQGLNPELEREQIIWEWRGLNFCQNILFWFSYETVAPITLFEYGKILGQLKVRHKNLTVGIHPWYKRKNDVLIQSELEGFTDISLDFDGTLSKLLA